MDPDLRYELTDFTPFDAKFIGRRRLEDSVTVKTGDPCARYGDPPGVNFGSAGTIEVHYAGVKTALEAGAGRGLRRS